MAARSAPACAGRRAPGPRAGPRRGAGSAVGTGRGDDRRGSVPGRRAGHGLRAGPAVGRRHRHREALRRVLGVQGRAQPGAGERRARASSPTCSCLPFEMAIRDGGARSVMHSYADLDGVPAAADHALLTGFLRDELGFDGVVVADYYGISFLETLHGVAGLAGPGGRAGRCGPEWTWSCPNVRCYGEPLAGAVGSGDGARTPRGPGGRPDPAAEVRAGPARSCAEAGAPAEAAARADLDFDPPAHRRPGPAPGRTLDRAARQRRPGAARCDPSAARSPSSARSPPTRSRSSAATPSPGTSGTRTPASARASR